MSRIPRRNREAPPPSGQPTPPPPDVASGGAVVADPPPAPVPPLPVAPPVVAALPASPPVPAPPVKLLPEQPAVVDMLQRIINSQRQAGQKFLLLVIPEGDWPRREEYDTIERLIDAIRRRDKTPCSVYAFLGYPLIISKGPFRFLETPFGAKLPLFDPVASGDSETEHGWLGSDDDLSWDYGPLTPPDATTATDEPVSDDMDTGQDGDDTCPFPVVDGS